MNGVSIVKVVTTNEATRNVLQTALDAGHTFGIGYWAEVLEETKNSILVKDREETQPLRQHQRGAGVMRVLTSDISKAIQKMISDPEGAECQGWTEQLLREEHPDGPLSDAIIQVAMFGKVIYG